MHPFNFSFESSSSLIFSPFCRMTQFSFCWIIFLVLVISAFDLHHMLRSCIQPYIVWKWKDIAVSISTLAHSHLRRKTNEDKEEEEREKKTHKQSHIMSLHKIRIELPFIFFALISYMVLYNGCLAGSSLSIYGSFQNENYTIYHFAIYCKGNQETRCACWTKEGRMSEIYRPHAQTT